MRSSKLTVALGLLWLLPGFARGQSVYQQMQCTDLMYRAGGALERQDWQGLIDVSRKYMSTCLEVSSKRDQTSMLDNIATGLIELGKYDDAIPVLGRCISIDMNFSACWFNLGRADFSIGRRDFARACWQKTVAIGGFDQTNAAVVRAAKQALSGLDAIEKSSSPEPQKPSPENAAGTSFGTGFFITTQGHILTNNHVIEGCRSLTTRPDGKSLEVISRNKSSDLALLKANITPTSVAVFRAGPAPKLGDSLVAFGFPLPGILSSSGNVSTGVLSATSGLQDDVRYIQISAPVQPGNSGGPLFDSSGHVIGVVVAKLDAIQIARVTGDVPQNVNFAVHWSEVRAFLDEEGIQYRKEPSQRAVSNRSIAATATQIAVEIECSH